jgi:hypothetical protein
MNSLACQLRKTETLKEQIAYEYRQTGQGQRIQRQSLTTQQPQHTRLRQQPASPHRTGHNAGLHPEETPFPSDDLERNDNTYAQPPARTSPRSAIRYRPMATTQQQAMPRRRVHWLVFVGLAMFIMIIGWVILTAIGSWWQTKMDDIRYGFPRTFQTDANVGHNGRVSHFICLNLQGEVEVIETQRDHPDASKIYRVVVLPQDQDHVPVTISFQDINGDGKLDGLVLVGGSEIPMYNNGTGFQSQPPAPGH